MPTWSMATPAIASMSSTHVNPEDLRQHRCTPVILPGAVQAGLPGRNSSGAIVTSLPAPGATRTPGTSRAASEHVRHVFLGEFAFFCHEDALGVLGAQFLDHAARGLGWRTPAHHRVDHSLAAAVITVACRRHQPEAQRRHGHHGSHQPARS
ncbi:MAG: hypothetical protein U5Q44_15820 [Dehalococcoidia bacterium]|nr:hypothetical protein [Dehalococcoidia bacterium]